MFYVRKTVEEGYSRSALINLIEADLYHKEGSALTNFGEQLPFPQTQLAQEIVKSNYDLGLLLSRQTMMKRNLRMRWNRKLRDSFWNSVPGLHS